jgi:hypothetical protein
MPLPQDNPLPRMNDESVANVRAQNVQTHEQRVEKLLTVIAWFTGIVAAATIANLVAGFVLGMSVMGN